MAPVLFIVKPSSAQGERQCAGRVGRKGPEPRPCLVWAHTHQAQGSLCALNPGKAAQHLP